ncbi:MAG: hemolysin family protein [Comamonas sp.]
MDVVLLVFLTTLNGVFAMSEMALATSRKARLATLAELGDRRAQAAIRLIEQPTQFLSTIQIGITSIGMLNGIVGEAAFAGPLALVLQQWGLGERAASWLSTALVVTCITFFTIIFGELVPKRIGQIFPEPVARWVSPGMARLARLAKPAVAVLSGSTAGILRLLRIGGSGDRAVTQEEIAASLEEGRDAGIIEHHEHQMVSNVFHLDDRPLTSIMVPRSDIVWLDAESSIEDSLTLAVGTRHSWYPVGRGGLDHVIGMISVAGLLAARASPDASVGMHVVPAAFVPETLSALELLEHLRLNAVRMTLVVDEYGEVQGLITPHDLLEAITGELRSGTPAEAWAVQRDDGSWLLDGMMPVAELKARLELRDLPDEGKGLYNTLAGMLLAVGGHLPTEGESIHCNGWRFEVLDLDGRRIDKVLAVALPPDDVPV